MEQGYYKQYFEFERSHWWFLARAEILRNYIANLKLGTPLRILNVGAATGATSQWLEQFGEVTSLEFEQECIDFVKEKIGLEFIQGSILELPFDDNSYDLICCFDVIEHVDDDVLAAKELQRVCKPGGTVMATVPAFMHLWSEHDVINHHFKRYQLSQFKSLFTSDNGAVKFASYFNAKLYPFIYLTRKAMNGVRKIFPKEQASSDFENFKPGLTNDIFYKVFSSEKTSLAKNKPYSKGVSIILEWKKNK